MLPRNAAEGTGLRMNQTYTQYTRMNTRSVSESPTVKTGTVTIFYTGIHMGIKLNNANDIKE